MELPEANPFPKPPLPVTMTPRGFLTCPHCLAAGTLSAACLLFFLTGCAAPPKPVPPPAEPIYIPKKVFFLGFDSAWEITLQALEGNRIPLESLDKEKGIIRTGYIGGPGLPLSDRVFLTRYKYVIILFKETGKRTVLHVRCLLEIGEGERGNYREVEGFAAERLVALEKELYRMIEYALLPLDGLAEAEERPVRTAQPAFWSSPAPPPPETAPPPPPQTAAILPTVQKPLPAAPLAKLAPAEKLPAEYLVTLKNAKLRLDPSLEGKVILIVRKGRKVQKIGEHAGWVQVRLAWGEKGWIFKKLLRPAL